MAYPTDKEIKEKFCEIEDMYGNSGNWNVRVTADELKCPADYVRKVLQELEDKGEL